MAQKFIVSDKSDSYNVNECKEVCGRIFWMYYDIITSYSNIGHNIDYESINYEKYFFSQPDDKESYIADIAKILRDGSFVALCCRVYNLLSDEHRDLKTVPQIKEILAHDGINEEFFKKEVLELMLQSFAEKTRWDWENLPFGSQLNKKFKEVYKKYVIGFFEDILKES